MTSPEAAELEAVDAALAGRTVAPEHAALGELALLLRDERPQPTLRWTTQLDRRVEAGFPARRRRRLRDRIPGWVAPLAATAVLLTPVVLAAALIDTGGDDSDAGSAGMGAVQEDSGGGAASSEAAPDSGALSRGSAGDPASDARDRRDVQRSASLTLAAPSREIDSVASDAGRVAADLGGFVASSSISSTDGGRLDLRVPSARLDTAIQRLSKLGDVRELSRESLDITSQTVSARERLQDALAERRSLLRQLAAATTLNETESIRARLRIVSRQISSARGALRRVTNRARFADVAVTLTATRGDSDPGGAWTPRDALDDALRVLEVMAGVALVAAAVLLPLLLAVALAALARRGLHRRRRERALDMA
jgi:hypothetical protein